MKRSCGVSGGLSFDGSRMWDDGVGYLRVEIWERREGLLVVVCAWDGGLASSKHCGGFFGTWEGHGEGVRRDVEGDSECSLQRERLSTTTCCRH